jgi:hypothetical protein
VQIDHAGLTVARGWWQLLDLDQRSLLRRRNNPRAIAMD